MDEVTRRTVRADRRFLWLWLTASTLCSVAGNVGHAIVEAVQRAKPGTSAGASAAAAAPPSLTSDLLFWSSVGWAVVPPLLLMLAVHGLPTLARMLGTDESDTLLKGVVWGVVVAAFGWSAFGIYTFTVAVGVPAAVAWVAPLAIDLSVFGATRGLVKTAPLAARLKVHESQTANLAHEPETVSHEPETVNLVREPDPIKPMNQDREPRTEPKPSVRDPKPVSRVRDPKAVALPDPSAEQIAAAEALVESGKTKLDAEVAAIVIAARASGVTQDDTAAATGVPVSTVKRTTTAARALEAERPLTAVG